MVDITIIGLTVVFLAGLVVGWTLRHKGLVTEVYRK